MAIGCHGGCAPLRIVAIASPSAAAPVQAQAPPREQNIHSPPCGRVPGFPPALAPQPGSLSRVRKPPSPLRGEGRPVTGAACGSLRGPGGSWAIPPGPRGRGRGPCGERNYPDHHQKA